MQTTRSISYTELMPSQRCDDSTSQLPHKPDISEAEKQ